jgi:hypothetical protein
MRARPRARTAAIRSRRCWLGRSEKDRFDMADPTGFRKIELRLSQLTRVMYAVWGGTNFGKLGSAIVSVACLRRRPPVLGYRTIQFWNGMTVGMFPNCLSHCCFRKSPYPPAMRILPAELVPKSLQTGRKCSHKKSSMLAMTPSNPG